jgi:hypothetical protein
MRDDPTECKDYLVAAIRFISLAVLVLLQIGCFELRYAIEKLGG